MFSELFSSVKNMITACNQRSIMYLIIGIVIGIIVGILIQLIKNKKMINDNRKDAVKRSKAVLTGQIGEQFAPFLPNFPCKSDEVRFIGKPIDFIGFVSDDIDLPLEDKSIKEILFIEVKTGKSMLTKREKEIKKAIQEKRIRYTEYRIG